MPSGLSLALPLNVFFTISSSSFDPGTFLFAVRPLLLTLSYRCIRYVFVSTIGCCPLHQACHQGVSFLPLRHDSVHNLILGCFLEAGATIICCYLHLSPRSGGSSASQLAIPFW
ncbi:hypothetical protein PAHAL_2G025400 [Panicum hallii]|uniref:Uncharacterized protein n=1 Tax=Panicum hallii TaxID=206008 RepID=A0A2T8KML6_9POAL|nr:hypothetical protein PAHAL_2G025400 [Panicum hallii]